MFEIPKSVTSKLAEPEANLRADAASHPEADLLTAFVERALPERERSTVMKHLAVCSACREIVALAQPEEVATGGVLIRARPRISRGLLLRWGALAACATLAVSVVVFHGKEPNPALVAEKRVSEPTSAPSETTFGGANKPAPAVVAGLRAEPKLATQPAAPQQMGDDAAVATYSRSKRASMPFVPGPAPMNNNAGFIANNTISSNKTDTSERNLPSNGRDASALVQMAPGASAGAVLADSKLAKASPVAGAAKQTEGTREAATLVQDKVAEKEKDDKDRADRSRALGSASGQNEAGAYAYAPTVVGGVVSARASAQGEIRGQVVDPSNAVVADAKVTIKNTTTGASIVSATNSAGIYDVPSVPVGAYTITVSKAGFQNFVRQGVNLEPPGVALDARLQLGTVSETVAVTAEAPLIQTETSDQKTNVSKTSELHASSGRIENMAVLGKALQAATWQVTDAGDLQRSFDGGKNWESVSVGPTVKLRVVATTGLNVWVGGHGGALFHSSDGGNHFTQVTARAGQITLTGDIVTLEFWNRKDVRIETADHEIWTTSDGGKTWLPLAIAK